MKNTERPAAEGCLLGRKVMGDTCENCQACGWNPKVAAARKEARRKRENERLEVMRLREARSSTAPDSEGWYSVKLALPEPMERVIVTDGVFVGEAYFGANGWTRFGKALPAKELGIFKPIAWMPMPKPYVKNTSSKK